MNIVMSRGKHISTNSDAIFSFSNQCQKAMKKKELIRVVDSNGSEWFINPFDISYIYND